MMFVRGVPTFTAIAAVGALVLPASGGPEWPELGDAGALTPSAQTPVGAGSLQGISGELAGGLGPDTGDFQDVFEIFIQNPADFGANLDLSQTNFDASLFLFDASGRGVLGNTNNGAGGAGFGPIPTDGGPGVNTPGRYFIAISGEGSLPTDTLGELIFNFATPNEVSSADGVGGNNPLGAWNERGKIGVYRIQFNGVTFVPAPGFGAFVLAGLPLVGARRRR